MMWYIDTTEYYSATRKEDSPPFVTRGTDLVHTILSKLSQMDKYYISLTSGILKMSNLLKNRE